MEGQDTIIAWLKLIALEMRSSRTREMLRAFEDDPIAIFEAPEQEVRVRVPTLTEKHWARIRAVKARDFTKDATTLARLEGRIITEYDPTYPANLRQLPDAPIALIARGELVPEDKFSIAIVGSRRASPYGLSLAERFARELTVHGLTVVSGGARGVDTCAHKGALAGGGRTIAYLGCGLDVPYPSDNQKLFDQIAHGGGAVLSEFSLGTQPEPWRFPARNRLISGTSLGVLVLESPRDSGSLITAREAADQGREVFAVPGPIGDGRHTGCHKLIQDGAKLVENVEDILTELGVLNLRSPNASGELPFAPPTPNLPPDQRRILDMLTLQPRPVDSLIAESGLAAPQISGILTLLELHGHAKRVPGNAFVRVL
jgi:DNA processing protein